MATYRQIYISFWSDTKVCDDFSPEDKYFYIYLLTNPHTNICGCYEISSSQMAQELGYNEESVKKLLRRMEQTHDVIRYNWQKKELLILNWHKYNWTKSPKMVSAVRAVAQYIKTDEYRVYINKLRRVNLATAADPDMSKDEVQIKRQTANHDLETDIGELVSYLNWLAGRYSIAAEEIREIKSYKVQRTRDRIELETGSICKKVVDDKAAAQAQDLADYCKQQTECEPGGCIFATTGEGCILSDYVRPELWPDAIAKQQQEGQKNG